MIANSIEPASGRETPQGRRILLVSYHYPPSEATGALRWQQLTILVARRGWQVDAISLHPSKAERTDSRRLTDLPPGTGLFGVTQRTLLIERLDRTLVQVRRWLQPARKALPSTQHGSAAEPPPNISDTHEREWFAGGLSALIRAWNALLSYSREMAWAGVAFQEGLQVGRRNPPDVVISCGPPHAAHAAGRRLARELEAPFVMDLRDPWSLVRGLPADMAHPLWFWLTRRAENRCVSQAALVVANTQGAAELTQRHWPAARVIFAMNGWDEEDIPVTEWPRQFRVVYAGMLYHDRTPRPFFRAAATVIRDLHLAPEDFQIRLIGYVQSHNGVDVRLMARDEGVDDYLSLMPPAPRRQVLEEYAAAALLLSLPQESALTVPSKVFEYMRFPAWVLAQSGPHSATGVALRDSGAYVIDPGQHEETAAALRECVLAFRSGKRPKPLASGGKYSRASEADKLFQILEEFTSTSRPRPSQGA